MYSEAEGPTATERPPAARTTFPKRVFVLKHSIPLPGIGETRKRIPKGCPGRQVRLVHLTCHRQNNGGPAHRVASEATASSSGTSGLVRTTSDLPRCTRQGARRRSDHWSRFEAVPALGAEIPADHVACCHLAAQLLEPADPAFLSLCEKIPPSNAYTDPSLFGSVPIEPITLDRKGTITRR